MARRRHTRTFRAYRNEEVSPQAYVESIVDAIQGAFAEGNVSLGEGLAVSLMLIARAVGYIHEHSDEPPFQEQRAYLRQSLQELIRVLDDPATFLAESQARQRVM